MRSYLQVWGYRTNYEYKITTIVMDNLWIVMDNLWIFMDSYG